MKKTSFHPLIAAIVLAAILLMSTSSTFTMRNAKTRYYTDLVNPFVGTDAHGHTFPGAAYPFGMIQLSPDTRRDNWDGCSGYHWSDTTIWGFSHTHLSGTGCADWCDILMMPVTGLESAADVTIPNIQSGFSHDSESASPGYYSVMLDRWKTLAEMTVSRRGAMHRYTFPDEAPAQMAVDLSHRDHCTASQITLVGENCIEGFRTSTSWAEEQTFYFHIEFSRSFESSDITEGTSKEPARALLTFKPIKSRKGNVLLVKVGISTVSAENARENLESDIRRWNFDVTRTRASKAWNRFLSKIEVEGEEQQMRTFYTALYHTAIAPSLMSDANGEYAGMDRQVHNAQGFDRYTVFSLWDTFRALHPLFNIIERERTQDFLNTFLTVYEQGGKLPMWELGGYETNCMIGYNAAPVVADAVVKGIRGFDVDKMLKALVETSSRRELGIDCFNENGLVLADREHESVSKTLEYANDDWCIAQYAKTIRPESNERLLCSNTYDTYIRRAKYYGNVFDPTTAFMRPRSEGNWIEPFDPTEVNVHYTEANSWQYSFHVQQDISGLISLLGGNDAFEHRLDKLFSVSSETTGWKSADMTGMIGQYAHGNEPSHHIAYLYPYVGAAWKTQQMVRRICDELYGDGPDGLCGNEDCGQMSAWYVFSALGFYPVTPGSDIYVLGSPIFRKAVIHLENGRDFTIKAPLNSASKMYIKSAKCNGADYTDAYIRHSDIMSGSTFEFVMSDVPDKNFGARECDRPVSRIEEAIVENPWFVVDRPDFKVFTEVRIEALKPEHRIKYRIEDDDAFTDDKEYHKYTGPFTVTRNSTIYAYCWDRHGNQSFVSSIKVRKVEDNCDITIVNPYSRQYTAGGDKGLVDGIRGKENFRLGGWQGYQDCDFEAIVDLREEKPLTSVAAGFLQDTRSWIVMPTDVDFYASVDGENYSLLGTAHHDVAPDDMTPQVHDLAIDARGRSARFVKVVAHNYGTLPEWHQGAGGEAFIFVDEIMIR